MWHFSTFVVSGIDIDSCYDISYNFSVDKYWNKLPKHVCARVRACVCVFVSINIIIYWYNQPVYDHFVIYKYAETHLNFTCCSLSRSISPLRLVLNKRNAVFVCNIRASEMEFVTVDSKLMRLISIYGIGSSNAWCHCHTVSHRHTEKHFTNFNSHRIDSNSIDTRAHAAAAKNRRLAKEKVVCHSKVNFHLEYTHTHSR